MSKPAKTYEIFKQEDFSPSGRVITVGYCVYRIADGERFRSYIPTRGMAVEIRNRMNEEAAKTK